MLCHLASLTLNLATQSPAPQDVAQSSVPQDISALSSIGLYSDSDAVFSLLRHSGHTVGSSLSVAELSKFDNMNYFGASASVAMLKEIRQKGLAPVEKIVDVGAGHGGTARVMAKELGGACAITALELQSEVSRVAQVLTEMAVLSGDLPPSAVSHCTGDAATGYGVPPLLSSAGCADAVVSRLCVLHIPLAARAGLFSRCRSWMRAGGVLAIEDYARKDGGVSEEGRLLLAEGVSVPEGELPTVGEWKETLAACGFKDVVVEDMTERWAAFVGERCAAANQDGAKFDDIVGPGRRKFYNSVDRLFNCKEKQGMEDTGLLGVRIYAVAE